MYRDKDLAILFELFGEENEYIYDHYINKANTLTELHQYDSAFTTLIKRWKIQQIYNIQLESLWLRLKFLLLPGRWIRRIVVLNRHADLRDRLIEERDKEGLLTLHRNYHNDELKKANTRLWQQAVERKRATVRCDYCLLPGDFVRGMHLLLFI